MTKMCSGVVVYTPQNTLRTTIAKQYFEKVHLLILCTLKNNVY